jgi:hypothetical protein
VAGTPCCQATTADGGLLGSPYCSAPYTSCQSGTCASCGGLAEACCVGFTGGDAYCTAPFVCEKSTNTCAECGQSSGQPCCAGGSCASPMTCQADGTCK